MLRPFRWRAAIGRNHMPVPWLASGVVTASRAASSTIFSTSAVTFALLCLGIEAFRWSASTGEPCLIARSTGVASMPRRRRSIAPGVVT